MAATSSESGPGKSGEAAGRLRDELTRVDGNDLGELIDAGRTLPSSWYRDDAVFELEQRLIFRRAWCYVGAAGGVASAGDYFTCEVGGVPVVVVRGKDGVVRGFVNICRHRHHPVAMGAGNRSTLQCMYHGWTYKLDGSFNAAPRSKADPNFDGSTLCLRAVRVQTLGDMLFVNPDLETISLEKALGAVPERARERGFPLDSATFQARRALEFKANWKIVYDNNAECYHCPTCHPSWYKEVRLDPEHNRDIQVGPYHFEADMDLREGQPHDYAYYVWPTLFLMNGSLREVGSVARAGYVVYRFVPLSPRRTVIEADLYHEDKLSPQQIEAWFESFFPILTEDRDVCERVQRAHDSDAGGLGTLITAIGSERHTQLWEKLVYRTLTRPSVPIYEPTAACG